MAPLSALNSHRGTHSTHVGGDGATAVVVVVVLSVYSRASGQQPCIKEQINLAVQDTLFTELSCSSTAMGHYLYPVLG